MSTILYAYDRYCTKRFTLPSEAQVQDLEQRIKVELPHDYREYVLEFNGGYLCEPPITPVGEGCPQDALTYMCGIGGSHWESELGTPRRLALFDDNDPPKIMPIGGTTMGGLIILDTAPGEGRGDIYLKQAFGDFYHVADGIEEFFDLLRDRPAVPPT